MRLIFKIVLIFFIILAISIIYMSLFGFETKRFNQQIIKSFQNIDQDLEIELNEIKIVLDPFELKFNAKTIGPNIVYKKKIIQIEYLKTNVPLLSIVNRDFLMENLEVSTKSLDLKNFVSFIKVFSNDPKLFLVENAIKKGFLIADINLNFDKDGNIKDNFNINGILKDTKIDILGKYQIDNLNFIFSYGKNNSVINNLSLYINDFKLFSEKIEIKKIGKEFKIDGDFENKEGELNKKNIDFFLNPLFKGYEINKINLNSKSNFSLNITEKLKVKNFTFLSDINLKEMSFSNNYKIKSFFPKIRDEIKLLNNDLSVKFINGILTINGNGKILLQENNDEISYFFEKKRNNTYDFDTSLEIVNNPLKIDFLNYERDINKKLTFTFRGSSKNNNIKFDRIILKENSNKIEIGNLSLGKEFKILDLTSAEINYLDKQKKQNNFKIKKSGNLFVLKGPSFNANNLIDDLINDKDKSNIINKDFNLSIYIEKFFLDNTNFLKNFKGNLSFNNQEIINGTLTGYFSKNQMMTYTIKSDQNNKKITTLFLDKAESIVRRYKFIKGFEEGMLDFYSEKNGDISRSKLKIYNFKIKELPVLTKLLTLASLQGIADILSGEGIRFDEFEMNFQNKGTLMTVDEIYAIGPAISILMSGYVQRNKLISLRGTLVPATTINNVIGSIPILGQILVGSKTGEGVFGVSFKIKGPPKKLETSVNPIKTLTPRFVTRTLEKIKKN